MIIRKVSKLGRLLIAIAMLVLLAAGLAMASAARDPTPIDTPTVAATSVPAPSITALLPSQASASTYVFGGIYTDTVWRRSSSPYIVTGSITLFPSYTLTIEPGVEVQFFPATTLNIRGNLVAEGTEPSHILFAPTSPGTRGSWGGVHIATNLGGRASIRFADFSYAQTALSVECCWSGGPLSVSDSMFSNNVLALGGYAGWVMTVDTCTFENNTYAVTSADKRISNSVFRNNDYGLYQTERVSICGSTFSGHQVALYGGRGQVNYCEISGNITGIQSFFEGFTLSNSNIVSNDVGVILGQYDTYSPPVEYNNLYGNTTYDLRNSGPSDKSVPNNWWGTTDTSQINASIYDGYDDVALGIVHYQPILNEPLVWVPSCPVVTSTLTPTPTPTATPISTPMSTVTPTPTPTSTPMSTVTPTPTPVPTDTGTVRGQVDLQGRSDDSGALVILSGSAYATTTASNGVFTITSVVAGTYTATASMSGYLSAVRTGVVVTTGETTILPLVTLRAGDINGDGAINIFDLVWMGINYGLAGPQPW